MPKAHLVLPQEYGFDDFYYYEDEQTCSQPEAIFWDRSDAEDYIQTGSVAFVRQASYLFLRQELEQLSAVETHRVQALLKIESAAEIPDYFADLQDLSYLSDAEISELMAMINVTAFCIVEAEIDEAKFLQLKEGITNRNPSKEFRKKVSDAFGIPIDEYEPF